MLNLSNNKLESLIGIELLSELSVISHNEIERIDGLDKLKSLTKLSASYNKFRQIPKFGENENMKEIKINNNKITFVHESLSNLVNLQVLDLGNNLITNFSQIEPLYKLKKLTNLNLKGNPIANDPEYKKTILENIPELRILDGERFDPKFLSRKEKRKVIDEIKDREEKEKKLGLKPGALKPPHLKKKRKINNMKNQLKNKAESLKKKQKD
ncbi:Leucine-rich repeat-containing protein 48 [Smittium culicis]|uniref:Leucine-rich repeat-containing protein 48 n=1 Tax=Smittium culicis TaxID=133412 RepID=A0A1R1WYJ7_9FUNG|nr:Leucine-rich repeat-containing protein 48 [Smittium culicis]